jgi:hypothetical protein
MFYLTDDPKAVAFIKGKCFADSSFRGKQRCPPRRIVEERVHQQRAETLADPVRIRGRHALKSFLTCALA